MFKAYSMHDLGLCCSCICVCNCNIATPSRASPGSAEAADHNSPLRACHRLVPAPQPSPARSQHGVQIQQSGLRFALLFDGPRRRSDCNFAAVLQKQRQGKMRQRSPRTHTWRASSIWWVTSSSIYGDSVVALRLPFQYVCSGVSTERAAKPHVQLSTLHSKRCASGYCSVYRYCRTVGVRAIHWRLDV